MDVITVCVLPFHVREPSHALMGEWLKMDSGGCEKTAQSLANCLTSNLAERILNRTPVIEIFGLQLGQIYCIFERILC